VVYGGSTGELNLAFFSFGTTSLAFPCTSTTTWFAPEKIVFGIVGPPP
jgi:hypothetical protein